MLLPLVAEMGRSHTLALVFFTLGGVIVLRGVWSHFTAAHTGRIKSDFYRTVHTTKRSDDPFGFMWELMAMYALGGILILAAIAMYVLL